MFYTSVVKMGNNIIHRYVQDGVRHQDVIKDFEYDLYLRSEYSNDSVDAHGYTLKNIHSIISMI